MEVFMSVKYEADGPWLNPETGWWRWVIWDNEINAVVKSGASPSVDECVNEIKSNLSDLRANEKG
jgi:hypothetical protein